MGNDVKGRWAQAIGFFGVITSLLFVAYELKQAREIALAELYQHKTEMLLGINTRYIDHSSLLDARIRAIEAPDELTLRDIILLNSEAAEYFAYAESNHFLYQYDLTTEEQMRTIWANLAGMFRTSEFWRQYWFDTEAFGAWRESFATDVSRILEQQGPIEPRDQAKRHEAIDRQRCLLANKCKANLHQN